MTKARELSDYTGLQGDLALKSPVASPSFTGNVGVGVTPSTALHVKDSTNTTFTLEGDSGAGSSFINFASLSTTKAQISGAKEGGSGGNLIFSTNNSSGTGTERMRISSAGTLLVKGVGTHGYVEGGESLSVSTSRVGTHDYGIFVTGNNSGGGTHYQMRFYNNVHGVKGSITTTSGGTAFNTSSDYRLKTGIQDVSTPIDKVKLLKPCNFAWVAEPDVRIDGFIAHEVAEVVPEAVSGTKDEMVDEKYEVTPAVLDDEGNETTAAVMGTRSVPQMQGVDQSKLVPLLTATIQELIARIEALEGE